MSIVNLIPVSGELIKTYNSRLLLAQKISATKPTYFFLSVNTERAKQWCAKYMGPRIFVLRRQSFTELFTQNILDKEGLKQ